MAGFGQTLHSLTFRPRSVNFTGEHDHFVDAVCHVEYGKCCSCVQLGLGLGLGCELDLVTFALIGH